MSSYDQEALTKHIISLMSIDGHLSGELNKLMFIADQQAAEVVNLTEELDSAQNEVAFLKQELLWLEDRVADACFILKTRGERR